MVTPQWRRALRTADEVGEVKDGRRQGDDRGLAQHVEPGLFVPGTGDGAGRAASAGHLVGHAGDGLPRDRRLRVGGGEGIGGEHRPGGKAGRRGRGTNGGPSPAAWGRGGSGARTPTSGTRATAATTQRQRRPTTAADATAGTMAAVAGGPAGRIRWHGCRTRSGEPASRAAEAWAAVQDRCRAWPRRRGRRWRRTGTAPR